MSDAPETFPFRFEPSFRPWLTVLGVTPRTADVTLTDTELVARFGPWRVVTPTTNIADATRTGPYRWFKVVGPHLSLADHGITFGTNAEAGVCIRFHEPVPGLLPVDALRHPGLTVTVAAPGLLLAALHRRAGLPVT